MNSIQSNPTGEISKCIRIAAGGVFLLADLQVPEESTALVIFADDSRCRNHPRIRHMARIFREQGLGTLLCDLLTDAEASDDDATAQYRDDANLLAQRLMAVTKWAAANRDTADLRIGYFGANAGGAAALIAAAEVGISLGAVVTRGGRMDLATPVLADVRCPTLLIVGENDPRGIAMNREALPHLGGEKQLLVVPGASHWFGEPGKLEAMAHPSAAWLRGHLGNPSDHH